MLFVCCIYNGISYANILCMPPHCVMSLCICYLVLIHLCSSADYYYSTNAFNRRLSEAFWKAGRLDLIHVVCSLFTSQTSTAVQLCTSSNQPRDSHYSGAPPLFNQRPLPPHCMTSAVSSACELTPSTALPVHLCTTPASHFPIKPPPPPTSSPQPRLSCGAQVSPPLSQQPGPPPLLNQRHLPPNDTTCTTGSSCKLRPSTAMPMHLYTTPVSHPRMSLSYSTQPRDSYAVQGSPLLSRQPGPPPSLNQRPVPPNGTTTAASGPCQLEPPTDFSNQVISHQVLPHINQRPLQRAVEMIGPEYCDRTNEPAFPIDLPSTTVSNSVYLPSEQHLSHFRAPPVSNQQLLIQHISSDGGLCDLRPFTALPTDLHSTPASHCLRQPPQPPPLPSPSSSPQPRNSCGAQVSPLLPQQSGPPACSPTTAATGASVQLQSYGSYLRSRYQAQVPSFALQWPPPPTRKIFSLAMIKKERVQRGKIDDEFVRLSITGKVDDILNKKVPVKLDDIFSLDKEKRKVILIEGAPGSGKSTLSWDICQRWGAGELFQEYDVVVLVRLRDPAVQAAKKITDLLPCRSEVMAQEVATDIVACDGKGVLWVLDGWDEISPIVQKCSLARSLIQSELYESSVIVTSRPIASGDLQPLASSRVEIVGFTPSELRQYFSECLEGDCGAVEKLLERIGEHPEVEGSCYLPLNAAIIVHLFLSEGQTIPSTQYGIFSAVVLNCIFRHLKQRTEEGRQIQSLESICSLPEVVRAPFENLCKLAYHGVMENKIVFSHDDFAAVGIPTSVSLIGLLQAVESMVSAGRRVSFNFLHLSIQELLAAFFISRLPSSEQISVFQQLFSEPRFSAVFQFYAAITKLRNPGIQSVITTIIQDPTATWNRSTKNPLLVSLLNCLFEAQDPSLCQLVAEQLEGKLDLRGITLTPLDCLSVGYFLSCVCVTTSGVFRVDLRWCSIDDHKCRFLTRGLCCSFLCVKLCMCPAPNSTATGWLHMNLSWNDIHKSGAQYIADMLRCSSVVHTLSLGNIVGGNSFKEHGLKYIAEALLTNCSLVKLDLVRCSLEITQESGPVLCQMLQRNKTLKILGLSRNRGVSDAGAFFVAEGLKLNTSLRALWLSKCGISAEGAKFISEALAVNTSLQILGLAGNELGDTGVDSLANALKQNDSLKKLYLRGCGMTDRGLELLAVALTVNTTLEELELNGNGSISEGGLSALTECLKRNSGLVNLALPYQCKSVVGGIQEAVNEVRRRSGLPLIEVHVESESKNASLGYQQEKNTTVVTVNNCMMIT